MAQQRLLTWPPNEEGPTADLRLIEYHPQRVLEAFRRGEFDQLEIIGQADEGIFRAVLQGKDLGLVYGGDSYAPKERRGCAVVCPGG
jgi:hypothetical protein